MTGGLFDSAGGLIESAAPLLFASMGVLLTELSGSLCLSAEGFMVLGAFLSWSLTFATGSPLLGILLSALLCALVGGALALFIQRSGSNPFIAALALNLGAAALTSALSRGLFGTAGVLSDPSVQALPSAVFSMDPLALSSVISIVLSHVFLSRTVPGLRLRAAGSPGEAFADRGLEKSTYRVLSWILCAVFCALAGATVAFRVGAYAPGAIAGRGWISVAVVYLGFRKTPGILAGALVFALADRTAALVQGTGAHTLALSLPSLLAMFLYTISSKVGRNR